MIRILSFSFLILFWLIGVRYIVAFAPHMVTEDFATLPTHARHMNSHNILDIIFERLFYVAFLIAMIKFSIWLWKELFGDPDYGQLQDDELKQGIRQTDPSRHSEYYD